MKLLRIRAARWQAKAAEVRAIPEVAVPNRMTHPACSTESSPQAQFQAAAYPEATLRSPRPRRLGSWVCVAIRSRHTSSLAPIAAEDLVLAHAA
jgi:transposase